MLRTDATTKMVVKGGDSGRLFFLNLHPNGKMDAGRMGETDIGKNWTLEGDKICRNYYRVFRGPQCGTFEVKEGQLLLVDADGSRNPVTELQFGK